MFMCWCIILFQESLTPWQESFVSEKENASWNSSFPLVLPFEVWSTPSPHLACPHSTAPSQISRATLIPLVGWTLLTVTSCCTLMVPEVGTVRGNPDHSTWHWPPDLEGLLLAVELSGLLPPATSASQSNRLHRLGHLGSYAFLAPYFL